MKLVYCILVLLAPELFFDLAADLVEGPETAGSTLDQFGDMKSEWRTKDAGDFAGPYSQNCTFKFIYHFPARKEAQIATLARTIGEPIRQFPEIRSVFQVEFDFSDADRACSEWRIIDVLDDMRSVDQLRRIDQVSKLLVVVGDFARLRTVYFRRNVIQQFFRLAGVAACSMTVRRMIFSRAHSLARISISRPSLTLCSCLSLSLRKRASVLISSS